MRFNIAVHAHKGTETEKFAAAKQSFPRKRKRRHAGAGANRDIDVPQFLYKISCEGGGMKGMLGQILSFV